MTDITIKKKTPLELASTDFAALLNQIENLDDIDQAIITTLGEMQLQFQDSIDRRIYFLQYLKSQIEHVSGMKKAWSHRLEVLENLESRIKGSTMATMLSHLNVPFRGINGELKLQDNPPALECDIPTQKRSFEVVSESIALTPEYGRYVDHVTLYQLNKDAIRGALADGLELPFARIKRNKHLRIKI